MIHTRHMHEVLYHTWKWSKVCIRGLICMVAVWVAVGGAVSIGTKHCSSIVLMVQIKPTTIARSPNTQPGYRITPALTCLAVMSRPACICVQYSRAECMLEYAELLLYAAKRTHSKSVWYAPQLQNQVTVCRPTYNKQSHSSTWL